MSTSTITLASPVSAPWQTRAAWEDAVCVAMSTASGTAVVLRLARYMTWRERRPGWGGDPGLAQLAADLHLSEKQVARYLTEAERKGVIAETRRHAPRSRTPHAAYAAAMPAPPALFDLEDTDTDVAGEDVTEGQAPPAAADEADYPTPMSGKKPANGHDHRTSMSGKNQDHRTPMSGDLESHLYMSLKGSSSSPTPVPTPAQIPLPPTPVGGGSNHQTDEVGRIAASLADLVRGGPRVQLAVRGRVVELLAAGYTGTEITEHAQRRTAIGRARGTINDPGGLLRHVLADGDLPPSRAARAAVREAERAAEQAVRAETTERRQAAEAVSTAAASRHDAITAELGADLHARIVRAAATGPGARFYQRGRTSEALTRSLAGRVYADHDHDLAAIRRYAEQLPPAPSETATATQTARSATQSTGPTPTHPDGTVRPSLAELEAAIATRIGAA